MKNPEIKNLMIGLIISVLKKKICRLKITNINPG